MRHYYRFMELEPVLEQEEDSVGEASPTSSMGSPSFSPPPDAWAQISSKDYHDPLSSHLLQEHLDLQRAYRLLEVQLQKYDTRASRDLQKMKDALPAQERLREELQRAKEREAALRGEIYDLHEQNELLEFRILELEECQENAFTSPASRDVATETDECDVTDASLPVDNETQRIQERLGQACESPAIEPGSATHGCGTRLAPADDVDCTLALNTTLGAQHEADCAPHPLSEGISCTLCRRLPRRRSFPEPTPSTPDQRDPLRKSKSDGEIIARRPGQEGGELSAKDEGVQVDLPTPRTPLFGGRVEDQVRTMRTMLTSIYNVIQETRVEVECTNSELREEVQTLESTVQRLKEEAGRGGGEGLPALPPPFRRSRSLSFSKDCYCCSQDLQPNLEEVISKLQQVMDLVTDTGVVAAVDPDKAEEQEEKKESSAGADVSVGVTTGECGHKEEEGKESKEGRVSDMNSTGSPGKEVPSGVSAVKMPLVKTGAEEGNHTKDTRSPPLVRRTPTKEVMSTNPVTKEQSKMYQEQRTSEGHTEEYDLIRRNVASQDSSKVAETRRPEVKPKPAELVTSKGLEIPPLRRVDVPPPRGVDIPPLRGVVAGSFTDPPQYDACVVKRTDELVTSKGLEIPPLRRVDIPPPRGVDIPPLRGVVAGSFSEAPQYDACVVKRTDEAIKHLEALAPLPEEKTKPVLRRWREQLLVRRDRVQPWRIEMLDFPKRLPSVV